MLIIDFSGDILPVPQLASLAVAPVHVAAPVVIAHDPHTHFDRNEIPQGPYLAPIPKKAVADTAFPTK